MTQGNKRLKIYLKDHLAELFGRHVVSVKRAIQRGELPPPIKLFGVQVWTVGVLIRYIETRLEQAAEESAQEAKRLAQLSPVSRSYGR